MPTFDELRAMVTEAHRHRFHVPGQVTFMDHDEPRAYWEKIRPRIDQIEAERAIGSIQLLLEAAALLGRNRTCIWSCWSSQCQRDLPDPDQEDFQLPAVEAAELPVAGQIVLRHCQKQGLNPSIEAWVETRTTLTDPWGFDGIDRNVLNVSIFISW